MLVTIRNDFEFRTGKRLEHVFAEPPSPEKYKRGIGLELPFSYIDPNVVALSPPCGYQDLSDYEWHRHDVGHRFPIREDYWITQLGDDIDKSVLFICGALHVCTFKERLEKSGRKVGIIAESIGCLPTFKDSDAYKALQDVHENGFPPVTLGAEPRCFCVQAQTDDNAESLSLA